MRALANGTHDGNGAVCGHPVRSIFSLSLESAAAGGVGSGGDYGEGDDAHGHGTNFIHSHSSWLGGSSISKNGRRGR